MQCLTLAHISRVIEKFATHLCDHYPREMVFPPTPLQSKKVRDVF